MDSDSPIASRTAGQPTPELGNGNLFTAMWTFKSECGGFHDSTDWLAPSARARPRAASGSGASAGSDGSYSYRRSADGDGRCRRAE